MFLRRSDPLAAEVVPPVGAGHDRVGPAPDSVPGFEHPHVVPAPASRRAVVSPASPAPTTTTSVSIGRAAGVTFAP